MINIAVDGPSGSGKSTLSRKAAETLGYIYVDTGAMFRSIGLYVQRKGLQTSQTDEICACLNEISIDMKYKDGEQLIFLNGEDVSSEIRTHIISSYASDVAKIPQVRSFLLDMQREIAAKNNVIMDGRDIGTVVLPNADVKIFLTASAEVRAKRRYNELIERGQNIDFEQILQDIKDRDYQDSHREIAPLKPSCDSIILDTSNLKFEQSLQLLVSTIKENIEQIQS